MGSSSDPSGAQGPSAPGPSSPADAGGSARRALLLDLYKVERAEGGSQLGVQATLASLALATIGALTGLLFQTCTVACTPTARAPVPDVLLAGIPLLPSAILAFLAITFVRALVRSFYARAIERELADSWGADGELAVYPGLAVPRGVELALAGSPTAFRRGGAMRGLGAVLVATLVIGYVGLVALIVATVSAPWKVSVLVLYGTIAVLIARVSARSVVDARAVFAESVDEMNHYLRRPLTPGGDTGGRGAPGMLAYLLLPRPDSLPKVLVSVLALVVTVALSAVATPDGTWWSALLAIAVFELLVYQARYQLNDVRGLAEDQADRQAGLRRRLPVSPGRADESVRASLRVVVARLVLAACVVLFLPGPVAVTTAVATAAVAVLWVLYEGVRGPGRGGLGRVLLPLALGYAVRGGFGVALAQAGHAWEPSWGWLDGMVVVASVATGVMLVTMTWALHAVACGRPPVRPHYARLLRSVRADVWVLGDDERAGRRVLGEVHPVGAPWNLAFIAAASVSAPLLVWGLTAPPAPDARALVAALVGGVVAALVSRVGRGRTAVLVVLAVAVLVGAGVAQAVAGPRPAWCALAGALPLLATLLVQAWLGASTYAELKSSGARLRGALRELRCRLRRALLGASTVSFLERRDP